MPLPPLLCPVNNLILQQQHHYFTSMKKQGEKAYPLQTDKKTDFVNEPEAIYETCTTGSIPLIVPSSGRYSKGVAQPAEFTAGEFADLIAEAEAGPFYTLEEMDKDFEIWEKEFLKSHGIIP